MLTEPRQKLFCCISAILSLMLGSKAVAQDQKGQLAAISSVISGRCFDINSDETADSDVTTTRLVSEAKTLLAAFPDPKAGPILVDVVRIQGQYEYCMQLIAAALHRRPNDALITMSKDDAWKSIFTNPAAQPIKKQFLERRITSRQSFEELYGGLAAPVSVGLAQSIRAELAQWRRSAFQVIWEITLLKQWEQVSPKGAGEMQLHLGKHSRSMYLCIQNTTDELVENVILDMSLKGPVGRQVRRCYFVASIKPKQIMELPLDEPFWDGSVGYVVTANCLIADYRIYSKNNTQPLQTVMIRDLAAEQPQKTVRTSAQPPKTAKSSGRFIAGELITDEAKKKAAAMEEKLRGFAKNRFEADLFAQSVVRLKTNPKGKKGTGTVHLELFEPNSPLNSIGGVPIIFPKHFLRLKITGQDFGPNPVLLDGHFNYSNVGQVSLDLYAHGSIDAPLDQRLGRGVREKYALYCHDDFISLVLDGVKYLTKEEAESRRVKPDLQQMKDQEEQKATAKLKLAKDVIKLGKKTQVEQGKKWLAEICEQYPNTNAATEARELLGK